MADELGIMNRHGVFAVPTISVAGPHVRQARELSEAKFAARRETGNARRLPL